MPARRSAGATVSLGARAASDQHGGIVPVEMAEGFAVNRWTAERVFGAAAAWVWVPGDAIDVQGDGYR